MLKVIIKTINVVTAIYVVCVIGGTIFEIGKEAGKKEDASEAIPVGPDEQGNAAYKIVDGILYRRVDK